MIAGEGYTVHAHWDETARVWWTSGEEIPGLCCQETTFEALVETVFALAPQLLVDNGVLSPDTDEVALSVVAERHGTARRVA